MCKILPKPKVHLFIFKAHSYFADSQFADTKTGFLII